MSCLFQVSSEMKYEDDLRNYVLAFCLRGVEGETFWEQVFQDRSGFPLPLSLFTISGHEETVL